MILGNFQAVGSVMTTVKVQDIARHEEGVSIRRLKNSKRKHKKGELEDICSNQKGKTSELDENNFMHTSEVQTELTGSELTDLGLEEQLQRIPTHLHMLYTQSIEKLDEKQRCQLANLLLRYQETFAKTKSLLGKCSVLKHHIDTAEAAPVRQPLRRTPQGFEGEEEKYLNE